MPGGESDSTKAQPSIRRSPGRRTEKISEVIAREIVHDIVRRKLLPGDILPSESIMLKQYNVGRASLREALRILEVNGLIAIKPGPGGGPVVSDIDSTDFGKMATLYFHVSRATFQELVEARVIMDPVMARLAAERQDEEVRVALEASLDKSRQALVEDDSVLYWNSSTDFHGCIAGVSGNRVLDLYGSALKQLYYARIAGMVVAERRRAHVVKAHEDIAKAIINGNATRAERLMREHMLEYTEYAMSQFPGMVDEIIDWR